MSAVIELDRVRKEFGGLRPLRVAAFRLEAGRRQALLGFDAPAAESLVNLLTGATLPDEGTVRVFGRDTSSVTDPDEWMKTLDHFGLVSMRAVLIDELTMAQNMAMALTLSIDPLDDAVAAAIRALAVEAGVRLDQLGRPLGEAGSDSRARCHLARALAADPSVLILEHANGLTGPADAPAFGRDISRVADRRRIAVLALTADESFARAVAPAIHTVDVSTGRLASRSGWRHWFQ